jgi:hypothetical protein
MVECQQSLSLDHYVLPCNFAHSQTWAKQKRGFGVANSRKDQEKTHHLKKRDECHSRWWSKKLQEVISLLNNYTFREKMTKINDFRTLGPNWTITTTSTSWRARVLVWGNRTLSWEPVTIPMAYQDSGPHTWRICLY